MEKQLYIFSGLGADERVFQRIDFSEYSIKHIQWEAPVEKESIEEYAARLLNQITTPNPILLGISFGGMMAVEIAKQIEVKKVIVISSVKIRKELPLCFRLAGMVRLHFLFPYRLMKKSNRMTNWFFGIDSRIDEHLLKQILTDTDIFFLKWAIDKIVRWNNKTIPENIFHIHGSNDKIFPFDNVKMDAIIHEGGHFMIMNKAEEVNEILKRELN
ncbi:MAG: alpha/beta hydrolase [Cytophagaceae bacterium]